ncbi:MAG: hypothetical protein R2864_07845 [Syntrophotaleaceae bacterium]
MRQGDIEVDQLFASEDITPGAGPPAGHAGWSPSCAPPARGRRTDHRHRPPLHRPRMRLHPLLLAAHPRRLHLRPARQGIDKFALYNQGIVRLEDVPLDQLNGAQRFQAERP